ncbi:hypothetical protein K2X40_05590 [Candidatus Babeliales bacterium]|nr:hypothetical protein [Candidatus Babeliales bacterium]
MKNLRKIILGAAVAASIAHVGVFAAASSSSDGWGIPEDSLFAQLDQAYNAQRTAMPCFDDHSEPSSSSSSSISSSAEPSSSSSTIEELRSKRLREGRNRRQALFFGGSDYGSGSQSEDEDDEYLAQRQKTTDGKAFVKHVSESVVGLAHGAVSFAQSVSSSAQTVVSYVPGCSVSEQEKQEFDTKIEVLNKCLDFIKAEDYDYLRSFLNATPAYRSFFERDLYSPYVMERARKNSLNYQNAVDGYMLSMAIEIIELCAQDLRGQIMNFGWAKSFAEKGFVDYALANIEALTTECGKERNKATEKILEFERKALGSRSSETALSVSAWHSADLVSKDDRPGYVVWNEHCKTCKCYWEWYQ